MREVIGAVVLVGLCVLQASAQEKKEKPTEAKWDLVFNGKTLAGWSKSSATATTTWKVEKGVIVGEGSGRVPAGSLIQGKPRTDFAIRVKGYGPHEGAGLFLRASNHNGEAKGYFVPLCRKHEGQPAGSLFSFIPGKGYELLSAAKEILATEGEEYDLEVTCVGNTLTVKLNGEEVVQHTDGRKLYASGLIALRCGKDSGIRVSSVEVQDKSKKP